MLSGAVLVLAFALSGNIAQAAPPPPEAHGIPGFAENPDPIRTGKAGKAKPLPADPAKKAAVKTLGKVSWPTEGTAEVALPASATTPERTGKASEGPRLAPGKAARPTAAAKTRVGGLPVAVAPVATAKGRSAAPGKVRIHTLGREEAARWGGAAMFTVERADAGTTAAPVQLALDYSAFAEGAGGAYGSRLTLVQLPACAATAAPGEKGCASIPNKITATNDTARRTVRSDVTAAPAGTQAAVYALTATASSAKGDYKATPLSPSASWSVSNSSGGFSWSYPLRMVPTPGDIAPDVTIGYSSQSADGRTGATNNQGSWIGEGFGYEPDYVERSYKSCSEDGHAGSTEQCWAFDNATVMLNGQSSTLVKNDKDGLWHFADDNGAKIEKLDGRTYVTGSDDNDGEYWKITTTDGTEYYFGLNRLPGWTSGKEETKSVWTAPVFGDDVNEPCYNATFSSAHCKQAWRWNLDYVKDRHGNVRSYFYTPETNYYALNAKTDVNGIAYHRAGYVKRIDYGQRDTKVYSTKAPASRRVLGRGALPRRRKLRLQPRQVHDGQRRTLARHTGGPALRRQHQVHAGTELADLLDDQAAHRHHDPDEHQRGRRRVRGRRRLEVHPLLHGQRRLHQVPVALQDRPRGSGRRQHRRGALGRVPGHGDDEPGRQRH
ncbi:hypothetical protein RGF97_18605 [Streptomyces roseicoloratus]|uniref:Uncharacterized protein n=1 Tax=Streptomyces roseicoloratus TaxID=2508722 RepID=A0ABY9RWA0_9ACTN|nr:hypothetical protein [Streptomyces roseicoloratus]WMX46451.1 hypothetical protein RGF97_18605 [Streptomyces roseicoloratus]